MNPPPLITVVVCTHNPDPGRLRRTLAGLHAQTLPVACWETVLVDNGSSPPLAAGDEIDPVPRNLRVIREPALGLSHARRCGFTAAQGACAVLVDDDNVLAPDYLAQVLALFSDHPRVGALGGKSLPEWAGAAPDWTREFFPLLALRDLGPQPLISRGLRPDGATRNSYPAFAPIGAGMALRRAAWNAWLERTPNSGPALCDRRGGELTSGGDNDLVLCAMRAGWEVGYFPALSLTHLIPASRLEAEYLSRLNRGIQQSWMQVLAQHDACPWPPLSRSSARLRQFKAWFTHRTWMSPAARIRWQGACGHFEGRIGG